MKQLLFFGHLYLFEGSQAADQWLQGEDVDAFAIFGPKAGQGEIQIEEEKLAPNYHLNPLMPSQPTPLLGSYIVRFPPLGCKMKDNSRKEKENYVSAPSIHNLALVPHDGRASTGWHIAI